jgi:predicted MFS family arabinose efflux permease
VTELTEQSPGEGAIREPETEAAKVSYRQVLRDRRLATLLAGDAISKTGDGMGFVGLPLLALELHGSVPAAVAVALVNGLPLLAPFGLTLYYGLGRRRFDPRLVLLVDSSVRAVMFFVLGALALAGTLTLGLLLGLLVVGSVVKLLAASARRLVAVEMVEEDGRLAVNGLLGTSDNLSLFVAGPALGGLVVALKGPDLVLVANGVTYLAMLVAAALVVPRAKRSEADVTRATGASANSRASSGWTIMRRMPVVVRLALVVFLFDMFYGPVEVALPLLVTDELRGDGGAYGALWTAFGVGALVGALITNQLRRFRQQTLVVAIIGGWAACAAALGVAPNLLAAGVALALGGAIYGPFLAVAYTLLQGFLRPDDQQPVFALWAAGITVALPLGLAVGGPLVTAAGPRGGIVVSAVTTALLVPAAWHWLRPRPRA